jgi:hypothetical protein
LFTLPLLTVMFICAQLVPNPVNGEPGAALQLEPLSVEILTWSPPVVVLEYTQNEMVPTPLDKVGVWACAPVELRSWQE